MHRRHLAPFLLLLTLSPLATACANFDGFSVKPVDIGVGIDNDGYFTEAVAITELPLCTPRYSSLKCSGSSWIWLKKARASRS